MPTARPKKLCICGHEPHDHIFYGWNMCRRCDCAAFTPQTPQQPPKSRRKHAPKAD